MISQTPAFWRTRALQQRRTAHIMKRIYSKHNWKIYFKLDMAEAIRSWKHYRSLLNA